MPVGVDPLLPVSTQTCSSLKRGSLAVISDSPACAKADSAAKPFAAVCPPGVTVAEPKSSEPLVISVAPLGSFTKKPSPCVIQPTFEAAPVFPRSKLTPDFPICWVWMPGSTVAEVSTLKAVSLTPLSAETLLVVKASTPLKSKTSGVSVLR